MNRFLKTICSVLIPLLIIGCFATVMNRRFEAEKRDFSTLYDEWQVRPPMASALVSCVNKEYWDSQVFMLWIPLSYGKATGEFGDAYNKDLSAYEKGGVAVTGITVIYLSLGDTIIPQNYEPAISLPSEFGGSYYFCILADSIIIPAEEDSIDVQFTMEFRNSIGSPVYDCDLSYRLWRREGKKLMLNVGK